MYSLSAELHELTFVRTKPMMLFIHAVRLLLSDSGRQMLRMHHPARAVRALEMHAGRLLYGPGPACVQEAAATGSTQTLLIAVIPSQVVSDSKQAGSLALEEA